MIPTYKLFISHSWSHGEQYNSLVRLLNEFPLFQFEDFSVPKDDPLHIAPASVALYEAIKSQMSPCHVVLVLAGVYASYSDWIQNEILIAKTEFPPVTKPVLAIAPWGNGRVSKVVSDAADSIVGWNSKSVIEAVRQLTGQWWGNIQA